jgi:hypothetical protein
MGKMFKASAVALICLAAVPATAMPIAPLKDAPSGLTLVAMGCGPGWTRGPYGNCHPMGYVAPGIYAHPGLKLARAPCILVAGRESGRNRS